MNVFNAVEQLLCNHKDRLEGESALATREEALQRRAEHIHDHDQLALLAPIENAARYANAAGEQPIHLGLEGE